MTEDAKPKSDAAEESRAEIDRLLLEGLSSGEPIEVTPEYWENLKRKLVERLAARSPEGSD